MMQYRESMMRLYLSRCPNQIGLRDTPGLTRRQLLRPSRSKDGNRRLSLLEGSEANIERGRGLGGCGSAATGTSIEGEEIDPLDPAISSIPKMDWRRLLRIFSLLGWRVKSSLMSSRAWEKRRRSFGFSAMDGARSSNPYICRGVESGASSLTGVE